MARITFNIATALGRAASAKKKKKKKKTTCVYDFPIVSLWELSAAMETRVLIRFGPKPNATLYLSLTYMMLQVKFDRNWPSGLRDIYI